MTTKPNCLICHNFHRNSLQSHSSFYGSLIDYKEVLESVSIINNVTRWYNKKQPNLLKSCQKQSQHCFILKVKLYKKPKQFSKYLGYFGYNICCQELSNIAQSGRTGLTASTNRRVVSLTARSGSHVDTTVHF